MKLRKYYKSKWGVNVGIVATLLISSVQSFGSSSHGMPVSTVDVRGMNDRTPHNLPIQWWATDNYIPDEHPAEYSNACVVWSLLMSALVSRNPEKHFLTLPEEEVMQVYDQYIGIMQQCFPLLEIIVSKSFKINENFLADHAGTLWHCVRCASKGDYPCASDELNDDYMDTLKDNPNTMHLFRALAEMYYCTTIESDDLLQDSSRDSLRSETGDFLELRKALFEIWATIVIGKIEQEVNNAAREEEESAAKGDNINSDLRIVMKFLTDFEISEELQEKCSEELKEKCRQALQQETLESTNHDAEILDFIRKNADLNRRYQKAFNDVAADRKEEMFVRKFLTEFKISEALWKNCSKELTKKCRNRERIGALESLDLDLEILEFIYNNADLNRRYWKEIFKKLPELEYDYQKQHSIVEAKILAMPTKQVGIHDSSIFLLGLTTSSYWDGQLWEHYALHLHSTRSLHSQTSYFKKGYFDGTSKSVLNIMLIPPTPSIKNAGDPYLKPRHAISLIPCTEEGPYWITQVYKTEEAREGIRKKFIREQAGKLCAFETKYSSSQSPQQESNGRARKYQRDLETFWKNVEKELDNTGITTQTVHVPRIFKSTTRQEMLGCVNSENREQFVQVPSKEEEWESHFKNYSPCVDLKTGTRLSFSKFCKIAMKQEIPSFQNKIKAVANFFQTQEAKKK